MAKKAASDAWQMKFVGEGMVAPESLLGNPDNVKIHPKKQQDGIAGSLSSIGWIQRVIVNKRTSAEWPEGDRNVETMVDGHARVGLAISRGEALVPVQYVDLTPNEEKTALAIFDYLAGLAVIDKEKFSTLLHEINSDNEAIQSLLADMAEESGLHYGDETPVPDAQVDKAAELQEKWQTATGQLWQVGEHRILCGDSTKAEDVARLMGGERARLLLSDPPYGVAYETNGKNPRWRKDGLPIQNDDLGENQGEFWSDALRLCQFEGDAYLFCPPGPLSSVFAAAVVAVGIEHHQWLIWAKDRFTLGRSHYHYRHENIFYGWRGQSSFNGSRDQDTVWEVDRPSSSPLHPTTKPTELCEKALENSSNPGDIVYDPFLGSGTTLVAAHRLGRRGRGIEIEPRYVAVVLERMEALGLNPVLVKEPAG